MERAEPPEESESLLCDRGLAVPGVLVLLAGRLAPDSRAPGMRMLRVDEGTIRSVFNRRFPALEVFDQTAREAELAKREPVLWAIYRLYGAVRNATPAEVRRTLQAAEVDALISTLQRLSMTCPLDWSALMGHCEREIRTEDDVLAAVMDPLALRHVLTWPVPLTTPWLEERCLCVLEDACRRCDRGAIRRWFAALISTETSLPAGVTQRLRGVLLALWRAGVGDLGMLAHEIAMTDVALSREVGWENTRLFCAQLRRITGPRSEALDPFLNDEDIDGALVAAEELKQSELITHFRRLACTYDTKLHQGVKKSVFQSAQELQETGAAGAMA